MARPPSVVLLARAHWAVAGATAAAVAVVHLVTRDLPIAFSPGAYVVTLGLATLFASTGTLVWWGLPPGGALSRFCTLFYLMRPRLFFQLWEAMRRPEFQDHFRRRVAP